MVHAQIAELVMIGLAAGGVGGMLGVGGSLVMIPAMTLVLGPDQHLYQSAAMIVNFFVVVPAVYQHRRVGAIQIDTVLRLIPPATVTILVGVAISELRWFSGTGEAYLRALFGLFLLSICAHDLYRLFRPPTMPPPAATDDPRWLRSVMVGTPVGLVAGVLGVGGGTLAVPLQRRLLGTDVRSAIANSAALIVMTSLVGATVKNLSFHHHHPNDWRPLGLAAILIPTAVAGSLLGSRLTHTMPLRWLKIAFFVLLAVAAIRLTYGAATSML